MSKMRFDHPPSGISATWVALGMIVLALVSPFAVSAAAVDGQTPVPGWGESDLVAAVERGRVRGAGDAPRPQEIVLDQTDPFRNFGAIYSRRAKELEAQGQIHEALAYWQFVSELEPNNAEAKGKIRELQKRKMVESERAFQKGQKHLTAGKTWLAYKSFIKALSFDAGNEKAYNFVKIELNSKEFTQYDVQEGDTLKSIAEKEYADASQGSIIAYFNDLSAAANPVPGTKLNLPVLVAVLKKQRAAPAKSGFGDAAPKAEPEAAQAATEPQVDELAGAREQFDAQQFEDAAAAAEAVVAKSPDNDEAKQLVTASYYQLGKSYEEQQRFSDAITVLRKLDPNYEDVQATLQTLEQNIKGEADDHYRSGIAAFVNQKLELAIEEFAKTLELDPDHPRAGRDLQKARETLKKLEAFK